MFLYVYCVYVLEYVVFMKMSVIIYWINFLLMVLLFVGFLVVGRYKYSNVL